MELVRKKCGRCGKEKKMYSWEDTCYTCRKEIEVEKIVEAIRSGKMPSTFSDEYVICPHCGEVMPTNLPYEDFPEIYEDGEHKLICEECGKEFILSTMVSYSWETKKPEEENV